MALAAMREWRAAPARVTPVLTPLLRDESSAVRSAALHALAASLTASRLAADDLASLLDDARPAGPHRGLPTSSGNRSR